MITSITNNSKVNDAYERMCDDLSYVVVMIVRAIEIGEVTSGGVFYNNAVTNILQTAYELVTEWNGTNYIYRMTLENGNKFVLIENEYGTAKWYINKGE